MFVENQIQSRGGGECQLVCWGWGVGRHDLGQRCPGLRAYGGGVEVGIDLQNVFGKRRVLSLMARGTRANLVAVRTLRIP